MDSILNPFAKYSFTFYSHSFLIMAREKYPEKCPWDFGPKQTQSNQENWKMINGEEMVIFARNKQDQNYFYLTENNSLKSVLAYQARLYYQRLLDKGYKLVR